MFEGDTDKDLDEPVVIEQEVVVIDENHNKHQEEMASPLHQSMSRGDQHSPVLAHRSPNMNGSLPNGSVRKLSGTGVDATTNQYLEKHDEAHFLANLLAEERQRCNQHKDNYNTLKQEHRKYVALLPYTL